LIPVFYEFVVRRVYACSVLSISVTLVEEKPFWKTTKFTPLTISSTVFHYQFFGVVR